MTSGSYKPAQAVLTAPLRAPLQTGAQPQRSNVLTLAQNPPTAALPDAAPQRRRSLARAARHDILRRVAPPLRHDLVVHLQSVGMMAEAISARLDRGGVTGKDLQANISKMNRLSRQAVQASLDVAGWMRPGEDETVAVHEVVQECVRLLATSLNFRGFGLQVEAAETDFEVCRGAARFLLAAAVLTLADTASDSGEITLRLETSSTHAVVAAELVAAPDGGQAQPHDTDEPLAWNEVQALAEESDVELQRNGASIVLRFPRAVVMKPLAMVPV